MNRNELRTLLNNLPNERYMAKRIDAVARAAHTAGINGWFDFIESVILSNHNIGPRPSSVPSTHRRRILLDDFLDEAYLAGQNGAFDHRMDATKIMGFCSPFSTTDGKHGKYFDEMTIGQKRLLALIQDDVTAFKKRQRERELPRPNGPKESHGPSTIEEALDEVVRESTRDETSRHPPE